MLNKYFFHLAVVMWTLFTGSLAYANGPKPTNIEGLESPLPMTLVQAKEKMGFGQFSNKALVTGKKFTFTIVDGGFSGLQQWLVQNPDWAAKVTYVSLRKDKKRSSSSHGFDVFRTATSVMPMAKFILIETSNHIAQMGAILKTMQKKGSYFATMSLGHREYLGGVSTKHMDAVKAALAKYQFTFFKSAGNYRQISHNFEYVDQDNDRVLEFSPEGDKKGQLFERNKVGIFKNQPTTINLSWEDLDNAQSRFEVQLLDMNKNIIKTASNEQTKRPQVLLHYKTDKDELVYIRVLDKTPNQRSKVKSFNLFAKGTYVYGAVMNGQESLNLMSQIESPFLIPVGSFGQNKQGELTPSLFSSIGHTTDGQISPLVLGPGQLKMEDGEVMNGTSYATPFLAALYSVYASHNIKNMIEETTTQSRWATGLSEEEKGRWGVVDGPKFFTNSCLGSNKMDNVQHYIEKGKLAFEFDFSRNCMEKLDYYLHAYIRDGQTFAPIKAANGRDLLRGWVQKFSPLRNITNESVRIEIPFKQIPAKYAGKDLEMRLYISTLAQWDPVAVDRVKGYKFNLDIKNGPKKAKAPTANMPNSERMSQKSSSKQASIPKAGEHFKDCSDCPEMVVIPKGVGVMGENPYLTSYALHAQDVKIEYPLAIGKYEITVGQWRSCINDGGCPDKRFEFAANENYPANEISWEEAHTYLKWLNTKLELTGKPDAYRLLSNAEFDYAARGGIIAQYHCGNMMSCLNDSAWYMGHSKGKTHEVGQLKANDFGLYDMMGNVAEWVQDCWFYDEKGDDRGTAHGKPYEEEACDERVIKGGHYATFNEYLVPGRREMYAISYQNIENGFRVARAFGNGSD